VERPPGLEGFREAHHRVLERARRHTAAVPENGVALANTARSFLALWQRDASILFRKEEEVLLPVLARYGGDLEEKPIAQMLAQHASIRGLVMELSDEAMRSEVRRETLRSLEAQLEDHIRLEERVVLPLIEGTLPGDALEEAASRLEAFEIGSGLPAEPWVPTGGLSFDPYPGPGDSEGGGWD
jgi:iron-sulfur cluster repair protein YtfE (RIC family)